MGPDAAHCRRVRRSSCALRVLRSGRASLRGGVHRGGGVLVVGAGITGIHQLHRALEEGFTARLVEAGTGVGGTWYWNRYPGARFDSESYTYGYLFSEELFDEWVWDEHFAGQPEIERYLNHVVDRFDLRRDIRFETRVTATTWDEAAERWIVETDRGDRITAPICGTARLIRLNGTPVRRPLLWPFASQPQWIASRLK